MGIGLELSSLAVTVMVEIVVDGGGEADSDKEASESAAGLQGAR
jgi:hypothetical protein